MQVRGKPRVIALTSTYPRWQGDKEPPFVHILNQKLAKKYEMHALAPHYYGAKMLEDMDGIKVVRFKYFPPLWQALAYEGGILSSLKKSPWLFLQVPFFCFFEFLSARRLLKNQSFDLIHAHWMLPQGIIAVIARKIVSPKTSILLTSHGGDLFALNGPVTRWLKNWVLKEVDAISVVSEVMHDQLVDMGIPKDKVTLAPMGVDFDIFRVPGMLERSTNRLIYAGRLVEKKGVDYLIRAFKLVKKIKPELTLQIYGDGPLRYSLEKLAKQQDLEKSIEFMGSVSQENLALAYQSATVAIMPSVVAASGDQEGLGLSIIEAMASGCLPVLSDLPATRDILPARYDMFYAKPADIESLSDKILMATDYAVTEPNMVSGIRQYAYENFSWDKCAARYSSLYGENISSVDS